MESGDTWRWVFTTPGDMPQPQIAVKTAEKPEEAKPASAPEQAPAPVPESQP